MAVTFWKAVAAIRPSAPVPSRPFHTPTILVVHAKLAERERNDRPDRNVHALTREAQRHVLSVNVYGSRTQTRCERTSSPAPRSTSIGAGSPFTVPGLA